MPRDGSQLFLPFRENRFSYSFVVSHLLTRPTRATEAPVWGAETPLKW